MPWFTPLVVPVEENAAELGHVHWRRGFDAAAAEARAEDKPLLVLFDEVPGCSTVLAFGEDVLTHPLLVEAAETLFVPVFVSNNEPGPDRATLQRFGEPTWNNPVVRVMDPNGGDLAPRLGADWTAAGLAETLVAALGGEAPGWLRLVAEEERALLAATERQTWTMGCFWQGEAAFGQVPGVLATRTGFAGGAEVVELVVDRSRLDMGAMQRAARSVGAAPLAPTAMRPSPADDRHALKGTRWWTVPMSPLQATRVNAIVAAGQDPTPWLSPRQLAAR